MTLFPSGAWISTFVCARDLLVQRNPLDGKKTLIKRVIAVAGDTIKTLPPYPCNEVTVPEGHVWVEGEKFLSWCFGGLIFFRGDQPFRSLDSNSFGPVSVRSDNVRDV